VIECATDNDPDRQTLLQLIVDRIPLLSRDEMLVFDRLLFRLLEIGRPTYGPLNLRRERRDWGYEAGCEGLDWMFYDTLDYVVKQLKRERVAKFVAAQGDDNGDS